jgi:hypothetical protein
VEVDEKAKETDIESESADFSSDSAEDGKFKSTSVSKKISQSTVVCIQDKI